MRSRGLRHFVAGAASLLVLVLAGCTAALGGGSVDTLAGRSTVTPSSGPATVATSTTRAPSTSTGVKSVSRASATVLPARLPGVVEPTCDNAPTNWLQQEVTRLGTITVAAPAQAVGTGAYGYLDRTFASCGETLGLHLSALTPQNVTVQAIRVGSYANGLTGRAIWTSGQVHVGTGAMTATTERTTEVDHWPAALTIHPTAAWPPGAYLLRITPVARPGPSTYVPLRILTSGHRSPYLVVGSDLTELAYNTWGGRSLYFGSGSTLEERRSRRAYLGSAHRPTLANGMQAYFTMDLPLAIFTDRHRITVDWTTDTALDADPTQIEDRATLVLPGHSEYWTRRNYDTLEVAQGKGVNLMVLGANEVYWQTRLTRDATGSVTAMTIVRSAALDPGPAPADKTVRWQDAPLNRPGAAVTGLTTTAVHVTADAKIVSAPTWLFTGTGLKVGAKLPLVYANEAAGPTSNAPTNLQVLMEGYGVDSRGKRQHMTTAYFTATSGAGVFHAGTTEWLCAIANSCADRQRASATSDALDRITLAVFTTFAKPKAGVVHPLTSSPR